MAASKVRLEGFTELSGGGPAPIADLVFVHGLQGHPEGTWTYGKGGAEAKPAKPKRGLAKIFGRNKHTQDLDEPASSATSPVFWPRELLVEDCPNARVLTYGYDSHISRFFGGPANQSGILAHGTALMRALEVERRRCRKRPIIFLVHSLGGLVLKQALSRSRSALPDEHGLREIYESTYAIIFFGTPHRGSSYAKMGGLARDIAIIAGFDARDTILRSLEPDAEILNMLSDDFARMLHERTFKVHSFQEAKGFTGAHLLSRKIVDNDSSRLGDAKEATDFINANHMMMCRFRDADDPGYRKVNGVVSQYLDEIQTARAREGEQKQKLLEESTAQEKRRLELERSKLVREIRTSLRAAQINERVGEVEAAHEHTFDWAFSHSETGFLEWLRGDDGLFWITGKPGSGKSTLMKYLHRDDRTKEALSQNGRKILAMPAFFFHARGAETEKSFDGLLRSLFYQLLSEVPELVDSVAGIYREFKEQDRPCPWSLRELRTAMLNLRRQDIEGCICIFIDALDEYSGPLEEIADFVKRLASPANEGGDGKLKLRVCASSRPETTFISKLKGIPSFTIQDWTTTDISKYASDRLDGCDRPDTGTILSEITSKADGTFLWVKLVLDELWQPLCNGIPIEEARTKLSELPTHLPDFYDRMLKQIHADDRPVLMAMLELVLCFDYVELDPEQLKYFCLVIDIMQRKEPVTPKDISLTPTEDERRSREVARRIRACSGGLLEISSSHRVQFVHQTVKSFIQNEQNRASFDGKSTRDMALSGMRRMMHLSTLLIGKMDSLAEWGRHVHYHDFLAATCPERFPHFDPQAVVGFLAWALSAESVFETTSVDLIHGFHKAMVTYCGESWLDTWWSTVDSNGIGVLEGNTWVRGNIKPSSFVEFAMQTELFIFVETKLKEDISANPNTHRSPKLLFYVLVGNARSIWENSRFLFHSPKSWQDFARFLLRSGFSANAILEMDTAYDRLKLMNACKEDRMDVWDPEESSRQDELGDHGRNDATDGIEGGEESSKQYSRQGTPRSGDDVEWSDSDHVEPRDSGAERTETERNDSDRETTDMQRVSILHLALAIACSEVNANAPQVVYRLDMLRVLVEEGGNANVSNYQNHWSRGKNSAVERSAIHYLLSCRFRPSVLDDDQVDVPGALHSCIAAFLNHGASPNAVDSNGISILELALLSQRYALAEVMLEKGAMVTPRLLLDSGEPRSYADGILNESRWRRPEFYTPEARRIAARYNTHWELREEEERQGSEPELAQAETDGNILGNLAGSVKGWISKRLPI